MDRQEFEILVNKALENLPEKIKDKMKNVAIVIEDNPTIEQLKITGTRRGSLLLGLYEGIPETAWGKGFGGNLPDKITIFQKSIETIACGQKEIEDSVKDTVIHEIAHHFGFDEKGAQKVAKNK